MKKIIALALALIMALSMASVAFAAATAPASYDGGSNCDMNAATAGNDANAVERDKAFELTAVNPGDTIELTDSTWAAKALKGYKVTADFTSKELDGASLVESVKITKELDAVRITMKESYTMAEEDPKVVEGVITLTNKAANFSFDIAIKMSVNNTVVPVFGEKKAADATSNITAASNTVYVMDEDEGGYVNVLASTDLFGTAKMGKGAKAYYDILPYATKADAGYETWSNIEDALGEDFDGIVECYIFDAKGLDEVNFQYDAYEEDPHFFYAWDGEKFTQIEAKYDDDEDVDNYVFTAAASGTIVVTDAEIVLAAEEETKNPDTGANDVVGVAAALAVVSLVAAGAVSLKK